MSRNLAVHDRYHGPPIESCFHVDTSISCSSARRPVDHAPLKNRSACRPGPSAITGSRDSSAVSFSQHYPVRCHSIGRSSRSKSRRSIVRKSSVGNTAGAVVATHHF